MTLTEQWKNRELQGGWYFVKFENGSIMPVFYCGFNREFEFNWDWKISKVLSRCSYEEWQKVLNIDFNNEVLRLENAKLKELLKECREEIDKAKNILTEDTNIDNTVAAHAILRKIETKIDNAIGENNGN